MSKDDIHPHLQYSTLLCGLADNLTAGVSECYSSSKPEESLITLLRQSRATLFERRQGQLLGLVELLVQLTVFCVIGREPFERLMCSTKIKRFNPFKFVCYFSGVP